MEVAKEAAATDSPAIRPPAMTTARHPKRLTRMLLTGPANTEREPTVNRDKTRLEERHRASLLSSRREDWIEIHVNSPRLTHRSTKHRKQKPKKMYKKNHNSEQTWSLIQAFMFIRRSKFKKTKTQRKKRLWPRVEDQ